MLFSSSLIFICGPLYLQKRKYTETESEEEGADDMHYVVSSKFILKGKLVCFAFCFCFFLFSFCCWVFLVFIVLFAVEPISVYNV